MKLLPDSSGFSIKIGDIVLPDCRAAIEVDDVQILCENWSAVHSSTDKLSFSCKNEFGEWKIHFTEKLASAESGFLSVKMSGRLFNACRRIVLVPLMLRSLAADHIVEHGRSMGGCRMHKLPLDEEISFQNSFQNIITIGENHLHVSHKLEQDHLSFISGMIKGHELRDLQVSTTIEFPESGLVESEPVNLSVGKNGFSLMESWAKENAPTAKEIPEQPVGWNTWDYYRWTVTEDEVFENAEFIRSDQVLSQYIKRIIIDDGWQYCHGEWDANPLFPGGMESVARKLTGMGFEPGLWFAPGVAEPHSRIAQMDSDMMALGESGLPCLGYSCMNRHGFLLDPTVKKTQDWLYSLFERYATYGYRYFKLDFLWRTLSAPRFHENKVPRGHIMKLLLNPIRNATRGKASILGCNYGFEGGCENVDAVRVSCDSYAKWDFVKRNVWSIAARFWAHKRFWANDPDFALCRGRETSDDPDLDRLRGHLVFVTPDAVLSEEEKKNYNTPLTDMTAPEAEVLMSCVIISGGCINLADKLTRLNDRGLDIARRTVACQKGDAGIPLDLFQAVYPSLWLQTFAKGWRALLINWDDFEQELSLNLSDHSINSSTARNFWNDESVTINSGIISARLAPHSCLLAELI